MFMKWQLYFLLIVPVVLTVLRIKSQTYVLSAAITLSCALIVALSGFGESKAWVIVGLCLSVVGDWFLNHQIGHPDRFLFGVGGFALAHIAFVIYASHDAVFKPWATILIVALTVGYAVYLTQRIVKGLNPTLQAALPAYALVSLVGLLMALSRRTTPYAWALYALGILSIVFSDTMIAESQFAHNRGAQALILPTYYLCHILIAASCI